MSPPTPPTTTYAFAHRGGTDGGHPENSLAAFADARARGAELESDVRLSRDGQPVLVHDAFGFRRGLPVWVPALPARWLARLGIPRLADLYAQVGIDAELSLDLKAVRAWPATLAVARAAGAIEHLWLVHDDLEVLRAIRAADPDVRLVHEARPQVLARAGLALDDHPARLAATGIDAQNTRAEAWTPALRAAARRHRVLAFGSLLQTEAAIAVGVRADLDALYSDHVDLLVGATTAHPRPAPPVGDPAVTDGPEAPSPDRSGARRDAVAGTEVPSGSAASGGADAGGSDRETSAPEVDAEATRPPPGTASPAIDAVLFDFGHTLFSHPPGPVVVQAEAAALGVVLDQAEAAAIWADIDGAAMDPAEVARGRDLDTDVWHTRWRVLYARADDRVPGLGAALDRSFHGDGWIPYADTEAVLRRLHEAGVPVGIISNTGWDVRGPFRARGWDRWITSFTLSYEVGAVKPDPAIFAAACAAVGADPSRTLLVGDDARADGGGRAAGLAAVVLVDRTDPPGTTHGLLPAVTPALAP